MDAIVGGTPPPNLKMSEQQMSYKEFWNSPLRKELYRYYILTVSQGRFDEEPSAVRAIIAQWEPSNSKWYVPSAYEGRTECGYTNEIWFGREHGNWHIEEMRSL